MPAGTGPDALSTVLTWLSFMETMGGTPTRVRLVNAQKPSWSEAVNSTALDRTVAAGYAREDAAGLHLTDAGRQFLAEQAEHERQRPR